MNRPIRQWLTVAPVLGALRESVAPGFPISSFPRKREPSVFRNCAYPDGRAFDVRLGNRSRRPIRRGRSRQRRIALTLWQYRQRLDVRVEPSKVAAVPGEQGMELRHFLSVESDRCQIRIVGPLREPAIIGGKATPLLRQRIIGNTHRRKGGGL